MMRLLAFSSLFSYARVAPSHRRKPEAPVPPQCFAPEASRDRVS
jgi:hypothetical protein